MQKKEEKQEENFKMNAVKLVFNHNRTFKHLVYDQVANHFSLFIFLAVQTTAMNKTGGHQEQCKLLHVRQGETESPKFHYPEKPKSEF